MTRRAVVAVAAACAMASSLVAAAADAPPAVTRPSQARTAAAAGSPAPMSTTASASSSAVTASTQDTAAKPISLPAAFTSQKTLLGTVLADPQGRTLYSTATPPSNLDAFSIWQPVEIPWLATPKAPFGKIALPDGRAQWSYEGKPLFRHERDSDPQDLRGQGLQGGWTAVILVPPPKLPGWVTVRRVDIGWVFANQDGMTIYAPSRPEAQAAAQTCLPECMQKYWRPLLAGPADQSVGRWTIAVNPDGQRQWTYSGRPLYTHTRDTRPGEMMGNSFAVGFLIGDGFRVIPVDTQLTAKDS